VKVSRTIRRIVGWLSIIFFGLPALLIPVWGAWGYYGFKSSFDASQKSVVVMDLDEWSDQFPGSFATLELDWLSKDGALMPSGRRVALEISSYISAGCPQPHRLELFKKGWFFWPFSMTGAYVYMVDGCRTGTWATNSFRGRDLWPH
jgi:hypothetical protein